MKLSTQILLAFGVVLITSIIDSSINYLLSVRVKQNSEFLSQSETIIRNSNRLHKAIIEMQSAFRGYLLTEDTTFIELFNSGLVNIPPLFKEQKPLINENAVQRSLLDSISILHDVWVQYADSLISAKVQSASSNQSKEKYLYLMESRMKKQVGKKLNDEITLKFSVFDKTEYAIRDFHSDILTDSINRTRIISSILLGLTIIVGACSAVYIVILITKRIKSMVSLAQNISKGHFTNVYDTNNDELTDLSISLNIMSDRLRKNIQELENRNTELNKFAYVVSHDLKAPVRGIYNVVQWIEEDFGHQISEEMRKYLRIIPERTKRMEDLINGLLDYARIGEKSHPELINTKTLVEELTSILVPRTFKVNIGKLPLLFGERLKIEQIFSNLVSNAVKYSSSSYGSITIDYKELKDYYEFIIKDDGIGIESEYHEKIFEMFQTLREKDERESTGIGLAIVKKIIEDQGGTIKVVSELNKGSEFIFTWPRS